MPSPDVLRLQHQAATDQVRDRVVAYARAVWAAAPSLRDADVDRMVARLIPQVHAGQLSIARLTNQYIAATARELGIRADGTVDRDEILGYRGKPAAEVYRRPAVTTYTKLSDGKTFDAAKAAGLARLTDLVSTDMQQAKTRQMRAGTARSDFEFRTRELTGRENCALCVIASTQRYFARDLAPIHPGCDCGERLHRSARDPGQVIDETLLERTHALIDQKLGATDRGARDLGLGKATGSGAPMSDYTELIVVHEHGELGPTLAWRTDRFTSEADIAALAN